MEKVEKENNSVSPLDSKTSSAKKPVRINPNIKITPSAKANGKEKGQENIEEKLKDFEKEEVRRKAAKSLEEQKQKIVEEVRQMAALADQIYIGKVENIQKPEEKVKAMYDLFKSIAKNNYEEFTELIEHNLENEMYERLLDIVLNWENAEQNTIHKLQILIRDLQDKTPKIHSEVQGFVDSQREWRKEKELEFEKSIETIRSQMAPTNKETGENEMMSKYKELCEYVDAMQKEGIDKIIEDRDEKIKELLDTKNNKLRESKMNIEEKIQTLKCESQRLKTELPKSRKDYTQHKNESKKLVTIIDANNQKKKQFKKTITKLNQELYDHRKKQKELKDLVESLKNMN
jgi:hypothetical protein